MNFLQIKEDGLIRYPFKETEWSSQLRSQGVSGRRLNQMPLERLAEYGVYKVQSAPPPPTSDTARKRVVEVDPTLQDGEWVQTWGEENIDPSEVESRLRGAQMNETLQEVESDPFVKTFTKMSPTQVRGHVANNVNNLADAKALLEKMALMLLFLAKRNFR